MSERDPIVAVGTQTRYYLKCELCNMVPMFWGGGFATHLEALNAATKHREAHREQPFCTCGTFPNLAWDDDQDEPESGHAHCRCPGRCCECGCLTKTQAPTTTQASEDEERG